MPPARFNSDPPEHQKVNKRSDGECQISNPAKKPMNQLNNGGPKASVAKNEQFDPEEMDDIQTKLDKQLGPEYVSSRPGAGGVSVSYIEGWKLLNLANEVFGFNGWFSEVKSIQVDFVDDRNGKINIGLSVTVRVTLKDGAFHEDIGYGSADNVRTKAQAFEKAKKEAMTDGLKRALRCFGNAMGNCLYDKEYLSKISGVKSAPPDFLESNLYRLSDGPSRSATLPRSPQKQQQRRSASERFAAPQRAAQCNGTRPAIPEKRTLDAVSPRPKRHNNDDMFDDSLTFSDDVNLESEDFNDDVNELLDAKLKTPAPGLESETADLQHIDPSHDSLTNETPSRPHPQQPAPVRDPHMNEVIPAEVGFFTARVAEEVQKNAVTTKDHAFNPQFISPSIRRTVDPTKSTPIKRTEAPVQKSVRYDNPRLIPKRQVGKPRYPLPQKQREEQDA